MENKRKAAQGQAVNASDADDRASKRRKVPADAEYDLLKEETNESTTHYGLQFLQQIRRTSDKTGRQVATYFEQLLPKEGNETYYAKTRMPISLGIIERKLVNHEFSNLSELESWFKRMVSNAKDFYDKGSQVYEDAERVRKALSNYMVKTNPAYKLINNYSAIAVPIPDEYLDEAEDDSTTKPTPRKASSAKSPESRRSSAAQNKARAKPEPEVEDEDDDEEDEANEEEGAESDEDGEGEGEGDGEVEGDDEGEGDEESDAEPTSGRRRGPGRPPKKPDTQYKGVDYKGLSFQQAQEKIIEELLRKKEQPGDDFAHFEPFLNLPPRTLKDYYQVIKEPICLKKLAKLIRGIHNRRDKPGKSDFKSWSAFEEKISLLWKNAYYYNEDGSEIAMLAKEMEDFFTAELSKAKAVVQEPPQPPSIKLKLNAPTPKEPLPRKIIIRAPGSRAESPGPATAHSTGSVADGTASDTIMTPAQAKSDPASSARQSPGVQAKTTEVAGATNSAGLESASLAALANGQPQPAPETAAPPSPPQPSPESIIAAKLAKLYSTKHRYAGRGLADALITNLAIRTHPQLRVDSRYEFRLPAHPKLSQQSVTITVPMPSWTVQIIPSISPQVLNGIRPYKLYVMVNGRVLPRMLSPTIPNGGTPLHLQQTDSNQMLFDAQLVPGINKISVQIVAATPKDATLPDELDAEFEMYTILANLSRQ